MKINKRDIVNELHKQARKNFKRRRVITKGIDDLWQADIVEMGAYSENNAGYRYLLTIIDTFSKFAWAVALRTKSALEVTNAMKDILASKRIPKNLQTDDGKEFFNTKFQSLMKRFNINHYSSYSVLKASIVERFNRTLKAKMWKEFSYNGTYKWIDMYESLIDDYNSTTHRTIKMAPKDVSHSNEKLLLKSAFNNLKIFNKPKFKLGDNVRISRYKHIFEKGYTPNWTTEIFKIQTVRNTNPITYILKDYEGRVIRGGFYEYELMKTRFPNTYLVEKIIKTKGDKCYIKWLGFGNEHNSWIKSNEIL